MTLWPNIQRLFKLLTTSSIDREQHYKRLKLMERDIGVPVKIAMLILLAIFLINWKEVWPNYLEMEETFHEPVKQFFFGYAIVNAGAIVFYVLFNRWPLRVVHWFTMLMSVLDALVISGLVIITGGIESIAYWVLLVLIVRNAISIPIAVSQFSVNLITVACYALAMLLWLEYIAPQRERAESMSEEHWQRHYVPQYGIATNRAGTSGVVTNQHNASTASNGTEKAVPLRTRLSTQTEEEKLAGSLVTLRVAFLLLWVALCYGVQVLFDRDRESLREAREFALRREQLRSTGRLAAEIAHRLKNPLAIINNSAYSLAKSLKDADTPARKQIAMIRDEVARSDLILTELMGYAQLSEGRVEKLNVSDELRQSVIEAFPSGAEFDVHPRVKIEVDLPLLMMQRGHLREIMVNLLVNAREASRTGQEVRVTARAKADFAIELIVQDDGVGIAEGLHERVFEAYFSTKEKGTGLGLPIVKQNVQLYGGTIHVESKLGVGSTFSVTLPTRSLQQAT